jgi:predicted helicase
LQDKIFPIAGTDENVLICIDFSDKPFNTIAAKYLPDLHFNGDSQCIPLYRYDKLGNRFDNLTDWALEQFSGHYRDITITKEAIFSYVYAVLHHPAYLEKYAINLKREFPRIPFYEDFQKWATWGSKLMDLHLNYETSNPYPLQRIDLKADTSKPPTKPKPMLKVDKPTNSIRLDTVTTLKNVPPEAWEYKLGNRSALEWILEYYKERKPKDPTILQKFNAYRFSDYKDQVIDLLSRVCTVSIETMKIIKEME